MARPIDILDAIVRDDRETFRRLADQSPKALRSFVVCNAISCDGTPNPAAAEQATAGGQPLEHETWLALHFAADCGRADIAAELIDRFGVSVDSRTRYRMPTRARQTPLMLAATRGRENTVDVLLARAAEVEVRDAASRSPLSLAAAAGHAGIVRRLLDAGANLNAVDGQGRTPLHHAIRAATSPDESAPETDPNASQASRPDSSADAIATVTALIEAGVDVNVPCPRESDGYTPLHRCFARGVPAPELLTALLDAGADPTRPDPRHGRTALDLAHCFANDLAHRASPDRQAVAREAVEQLQRYANIKP